VNPSLYSKLPYGPKDFEMVNGVFIVPLMIVAHPSLPYNTAAELIAAAKKDPNKLNIGYAGTGTSQHLTGELFKSSANVEMTGVNYKGSGPAMTDLLGGNITAIFASTPTAVPLIQGGKLRPIAVTSPKRTSGLPNVPTVAEQGYPGYQALNWYAFVAPPKVPPAIIDKLNQAITTTLKDPGTVERLRQVDLDAAPSTPQELLVFVKLENDKWAKIIKSINLSEK
jgi:tripartite-type tricarboxylate transporter receptor subunit TctC